MFSALLIYFLIYKREKIIRESFDQLTHSVFNDPLTSLPNKAAFLNYMNELTRKARAYNVVYINLDNFRFINDTLGHQVGDEYLSYIAKRLDSLRHKNEYLARLDGDEFGLLIPNYTKKEEVEARLDELTQDLDGHWCMENHQFFISFSAGIASWPKDGITSFDIYKHANIALNRAKKSGKKTRAFFEEVELADINERVKLANDLQRAIEEEEFFLHYQPLHELKTRQIGGLEALIRWQDGSNNFISPVNFIPIAEETGQIFTLDRWVLRQVLMQKEEFEKKGIPWDLGANLSSRTLMNEVHFPSYLEIFDQYKVNLSEIVIEITETAVIDNIELAIERVKDLKSKGVKIALDDFGTGFSSLTHLKRLPIDTIKIDRAFISSVIVDSKESIIIESLIQMCTNLGLVVIAEGIESEEQLVYLRDHGCMIGQGYHLNKPDRIEKFI